mgnify:CR=1 FL=1
MPDLRFLLKVSRPRFWFYVFGPYIVGLAAGSQNINEFIIFGVVLYGLYFLFPANLLIYGINDLFDYETDKINDKKANYETLVTPERRPLLWAAIIASTFPFAFIVLNFYLWRGLVPVVISGVGFLFFSIFYSAPPIRAKTKPFLDSAFNILYVLPGVFGYALLTDQFPPALLMVAAALWTAAMHAYSAIPDITADRIAGVRTIATLCGPYLTLAICAVLYAAAALLSIPYLGFVSISLGAAYVLLMLASVWSYRSGRLFKLYRAFPIINVVAGFILFWEIVLRK